MNAEKNLILLAESDHDRKTLTEITQRLYPQITMCGLATVGTLRVFDYQIVTVREFFREKGMVITF